MSQRILLEYSQNEVKELADKNPQNIYISIDCKIYNITDFLKKVYH
jgi:hypothetical protein